jgi:hypothetical protein
MCSRIHLEGMDRHWGLNLGEFAAEVTHAIAWPVVPQQLDARAGGIFPVESAWVS